MSDKEIYRIALEFRNYIESARDANLFRGDIFADFPRACCGDASDLLAEYLKQIGIDSIYVHYVDSETHGGHSWLVIKDHRVSTPTNYIAGYEGYGLNLVNRYHSDDCDDSNGHFQYCEDDISGGLIIDITADQFFDFPVFVGFYEDAYRRFEFRWAQDYDILKNKREHKLYQKTISMKR